jgi:plastocyanin
MAQNEVNQTNQSGIPGSPMSPSRTPSSWSNRNIIIGLTVLVVLIVAVSYFSLNTKPKQPANNSKATVEPAKIAPATVKIAKNKFLPSTLYIKTGQAVVWTNADKAKHSIASDNQKPVFASKSLNKNDTFSYVFNKAGTYPYHDNANTRLAGIIVVK